MGPFKNYVHSRFLSFDPPLLLYSPLLVFEHSPPPSPPKSMFVLARTHPRLLNFYTCELYRKEINNEYSYLWLNSTRLLRSHSGISIKWAPLVQDKCPLHEDVCFIDSPSKNQKSSKVKWNPLSVMTFQVQIYWKDQRTERLKKMQSLCHSEVLKQGSLH